MSRESAALVFLSPDVSPIPTPYITAPSSPKPASEFSDGFTAFPEFHDLDEIEYREPSCSSVSFIDWRDHEIISKHVKSQLHEEEKITNGHNNSTYYAADHSEEEDEDITFEFRINKLESCFSPLPAEELFHGGKIKPLKPPLSQTASSNNNNSLRRRRHSHGLSQPMMMNPCTTPVIMSPDSTSSMTSTRLPPRPNDSVDLDTRRGRCITSKLTVRPQSCDFSSEVDPFRVTNAKGRHNLIYLEKAATGSRGSLMNMKGWRKRLRNLFTLGNNNSTVPEATGAVKIATTSSTTTTRSSSFGSKTTSFASSRSGSGSGSSSSSASSFKERCNNYEGSCGSGSYYPNYYGLRATDEEGFGGRKTFMPYKQGLLSCFVKRV